MGFGKQEVVGGDRCRGSLKALSFNLINRQINCFNCSPPSVVLTKHFALPLTAMPAPDCIGIASSCVPSPAAVPASAPPCVGEPLQYICFAPTTTAPAPAAFPASAVFAVRPLFSLTSESAAVPCPVSTCAKSNSASLGPDSSSTAPELVPTHLDSDPLLSVAMTTASATQRAP